MIRIERLTNLQGREMPGFFVRNASNKVLAIGTFSANGGFVMPSRKRYARDISLCEALGRVTGLPVKWNLSCYGHHITSGTNQELMQIVKRHRKFGL